MGRHVRPEHTLGSVVHVGTECFGYRTVRRAHVFVATSEQHRHLVLVGLAGRLGDQGRLTLAWFAGDEDDLVSHSAGHTLSRIVEKA